MNNLILELLDLAKARDSKFEYDNIHGLIEKMILLVSPQSNAKKIEVIRQFDPNITYACVDSDKLFDSAGYDARRINPANRSGSD